MNMAIDYYWKYKICNGFQRAVQDMLNLDKYLGDL